MGAIEPEKAISSKFQPFEGCNSIVLMVWWINFDFLYSYQATVLVAGGGGSRGTLIGPYWPYFSKNDTYYTLRHKLVQVTRKS